jgi:hypothetical protein
MGCLVLRSYQISANSAKDNERVEHDDLIVNTYSKT